MVYNCHSRSPLTAPTPLSTTCRLTSGMLRDSRASVTAESVPEERVMVRSYVTRHTSHVTRHTSHATRHTSHATRHTSHATRHTSHVARHTSHVTRHTSHVTRHTSHVTRHTPHVTRHTPQFNQPKTSLFTITARLLPSRPFPPRLSRSCAKY